MFPVRTFHLWCTVIARLLLVWGSTFKFSYFMGFKMQERPLYLDHQKYRLARVEGSFLHLKPIKMAKRKKWPRANISPGIP